MVKVNLQTGEGMEQTYKGYEISIIDLGAGNTKVVVNHDNDSEMQGIYQICGGGNNFPSVKAAKEAISSLK